MFLRKWDDIPDFMKNDEVYKYYQVLSKHRCSILCKRTFDVFAAFILIIILSPTFFIVAIIVKLDSNGSVFFQQLRTTQYGRTFKIFKFRTMVSDAETRGTQITTNNDNRITKAGHALRKYRLDEIPQLFNIILGDMSFVGTRPEVPKYVHCYTDEMLATLLLPAGVTSEASIAYKDEMQLLINADNADEAYVQQVLPEKMKYNLKSLQSFDFLYEMKVLLRTVSIILS